MESRRYYQFALQIKCEQQIFACSDEDITIKLTRGPRTAKCEHVRNGIAELSVSRINNIEYAISFERSRSWENSICLPKTKVIQPTCQILLNLLD